MQCTKARVLIEKLCAKFVASTEQEQ